MKCLLWTSSPEEERSLNILDDGSGYMHLVAIRVYLEVSQHTKFRTSCRCVRLWKCLVCLLVVHTLATWAICLECALFKVPV